MLDSIVVIAFLVLTLFIGSFVGRKVTTLKDFAVGGRNYNSFFVFATLSASFIGGGYTFGLTEKVFEYGMVYTLCMFGFSLQQLLVGYFVAPRMGQFQSAITTGDIMQKLYGPAGKLIAGIAAVAVCTGIIGAQVNATGYVFHNFLGWDKTTGILVGCSIVILYSAYGGMKAVIATDVMQFIVLVIMIPLVLVFAVYSLGGWDILIDSITQAQTHEREHLSLATIIGLFLSLLIGETLVPPYVQRLFIAKNITATKRGILSSGFLSIPFFTIIGAIGLAGVIMLPTIDPNLTLPSVIDKVMPIGLKGLAIAAIIAVVMSSADSFLNAASVAFVHDLIKPYKRLTPKQELLITRTATVVIGILAVIFALNIASVLDILLYSYNFWAPVILIPFVAGIMGRNASPKIFILSAISGICAVVFWNIFFAQNTQIDGLVIGTMINFLIFWGLSYSKKQNKTYESDRTEV
jgi:solute:Na+ symporter, SSS family